MERRSDNKSNKFCCCARIHSFRQRKKNRISDILKFDPKFQIPICVLDSLGSVHQRKQKIQICCKSNRKTTFSKVNFYFAALSTNPLFYLTKKRTVDEIRTDVKVCHIVLRLRNINQFVHNKNAIKKIIYEILRAEKKLYMRTLFFVSFNEFFFIQALPHNCSKISELALSKICKYPRKISEFETRDCSAIKIPFHSK